MELDLEPPLVQSFLDTDAESPSNAVGASVGSIRGKGGNVPSDLIL